VVVEGRKTLGDLLAGGFGIESVFVDESSDDDGLDLLLDSCDVHGIWVGIVDHKIFREVTDLTSPSGVVALAARPEYSFEELLRCEVILACDGLQDPGNVGTLIRSARSIGNAGVLCGPGTADPFGPRSVRASAGAALSTRMLTVESLSASLSRARAEASFEIVGLAALGAETLWNQRFASKVVVVVGSEGRGISPENAELVDRMVAIPIDSGVESLNAATSGSIALFEIQRQRHVDALRSGGTSDG
jgi:TrmH family RNA methyltransferase